MKLAPALLLARRCLTGADDATAEKRSRYLRGAVAGVALSLVPLVVVLVVADGMIEGITARYIETGSYHLQAQPLLGADGAELESRSEALRTLPGVKGAWVETQGAAVALIGSRSAGAALRAVDPSFLADPGTLAYLRTVEGEGSLASANEILLGEALARSLGAHPGSIVSVVTARPGAGEGGRELLPKVTAFRVKGVVSAGYRELDSLWAFVSARAGAKTLFPSNSTSFVGIKVEDPFARIDGLREAAKESLPMDWTVSTWQESNRNLYSSFRTTRSLLLLVMALAVAVASVNVGSALSMLAIERRRDIAILKSAGAPRTFVGAVFILAGMATGGLGTLLGLAAGSLLAWRVNDIVAALEWAANAVSGLASSTGLTQASASIKILDPAYYLERIPVAIDPASLAAVALTSLGLCLVSSLYPAWRASALPPMEIFRKT